MSLVIELFSTGVSKTLDGVKSANVKNNLEQEIQKYFDLHEDIVDLQLDTFLSKTNVLREMVQFLIDHKNEQLYKDKLDNWTEDYISFYGNGKISPYECGIIRGAIDRIYEIIDRNLGKEYLSLGQEYSLHEIRQSELRITKEIQELQEGFQKLSESFELNDTNIRQATTVLRDDSMVEGEFNTEIKSICDNYQRKEKYKEAIEEYDKLLTKYALHKTENKNLVEEIISNIAICYINLGLFNDAYQRLKCCDFESYHIAKYYYVTAYYYLNIGGIDGFKNADEYAKEAIKCKDDYVEAHLICLIAQSFLGAKTDNSLRSLDELFEKYTNLLEKSSFYWQARGLVYRNGCYYQEAIACFEKAHKISALNVDLFNIGICYYDWALPKGNKKNFRMPFDFDVSMMRKAEKYFNDICKNNHRDIIWYKSLELLLSCKQLCYEKIDFDEIGLVIDDPRVSDETKRRYYYELALQNKDYIPDNLSEADKEYLDVLNRAKAGQEIEAIDIASKAVRKGIDADGRMLYLLLDMLLHNDRLKEFKEIRSQYNDEYKQLSSKDILEAIYFAKSGDIDRANEYFDLYTTRKDIGILERTSNYYKDTKQIEKRTELYRYILRGIKTGNIAMGSCGFFYGEIFAHLAKYDYAFAEEYLDVLSEKECDSEEQYYRIKVSVYQQTNDSEKMLYCLKKIYDNTRDIKQLEHLAYLSMECMLYDEAIGYCQRALKLNGPDEYKADICNILSEVYILQDKLEEAYQILQQGVAYGEKYPNSNIHAVYTFRCMRCGKDTGISYGINFKHKYPNTVPWLKEFTAIEKDAEGQDKLTDETVAIFNSFKEQFEREKGYLNSPLGSFCAFEKMTNKKLSDLLFWQDIYSIKIKISNGDFSIPEIEAKNKKDAVVIDALGLMLIAKFNLFEIVRKTFKQIYITYSTIRTLQSNYILDFTKEGIKYAGEALKFIEKDLTVEKVANYHNVLKLEFAEIFSDSVTDSIACAKKLGTTYLYPEYVIKACYENQYDGLIGIMGLVSAQRKSNPTLASEIVYRLIHGKMSFVNFNIQDVVYAFEKNDWTISVDQLMPYVRYKSDCEIYSYLSVYFGAYDVLVSKNEEAAAIWKQEVLKEFDRVYNRAKNMTGWWTENKDSDELDAAIKLLAAFKIAKEVYRLRIERMGKSWEDEIRSTKWKYIPEEVALAHDEKLDEVLNQIEWAKPLIN